MRPHPHPLPSEPTEGEIQHAAYRLWEEQGRPVGRDLEIWLAAKTRLEHAAPACASALRRPIRATFRARNAQGAPPGRR